MIENLVILVGYGYVGALIPSSVFWKSGITRNEMNGYGTMDGKCGIFDNFTGKMIGKGLICLDYPLCAGGRGKSRPALRHVSLSGPF